MTYATPPEPRRPTASSTTIYGSLDELIFDILLTKPGRDGYSYELEYSSQTFRAVARCFPASFGRTSWVVDQSDKLQPVPRSQHH